MRFELIEMRGAAGCGTRTSLRPWNAGCIPSQGLTEDVLAENFTGVDVLVAQRGQDAFDRFNLAQCADG